MIHFSPKFNTNRTLKKNGALKNDPFFPMGLISVTFFGGEVLFKPDVSLRNLLKPKDPTNTCFPRTSIMPGRHQFMVFAIVRFIDFHLFPEAFVKDKRNT